MALVECNYDVVALNQQSSLKSRRENITAAANRIFMAALCNRGAIIFLPCDFYLLSFYLLFFLA